jgi:hypothetical protein
MNDDPVRWKDGADAPAGLRALLVEGRGVPPMPADVRAALLAGLLVPPAAPPPPAPAAVASGSAAWIAGAVAVVAVTIAAIVWATRPAEPPPTRPTIALSTSSGVPAAPPPASVSAVTAAPPALSAAAVSSSLPAPEGVTVHAPRPPAVSALPAAASALPSAATSAAETSNLAEESALIGKARAELVANPAAALAEVDEHARRFPRGELGPEREYLRVSALRRLGRNEEARSRGERYLTLFPTSPYAASVRTILAELGDR